MGTPPPNTDRSVGNAVATTLATIGVIFGSYLMRAQTEFHKRITIKEKYYRNNTLVVADTNDDSYEITYSLWDWHWDTDRVYSALEVGKMYTVKGFGFRSPFFRAFPTIIEATEVVE